VPGPPGDEEETKVPTMTEEVPRGPMIESSAPRTVASLASVTVRFTLAGTEGPVTREAVSNVTLDVHEGELLVLVGRSGCGKTTVLNLLGGLIAPSEGNVTVTGTSPKAARSHVGYMFARDALLPWRTAIRNVEFALELRQPELGRRERRTHAQNFLDELGVGPSAKLYPWQLSQGMRQRVALARTWAVEPDVLLMDEPFAALDAQTREAAQQLFLDSWSRHRRTVVFVTHDLSEAILLADRIVMLADGRIVDEAAVGIERPRNPETILLHPEYRALHQRLVASLHHPTHASHSD
jgi:NitT/TauT family transport system ATP-binding protein